MTSIENKLAAYRNMSQLCKFVMGFVLHMKKSKKFEFSLLLKFKGLCAGQGLKIKFVNSLSALCSYK